MFPIENIESGHIIPEKKYTSDPEVELIHKWSPHCIQNLYSFKKYE